MVDASHSEKISVRVIRNGEPEPLDKEWAKASPAERIEGVWMLTKLCLPGTTICVMSPDFSELFACSTLATLTIW
jgi:hypothetical protein